MDKKQKQNQLIKQLGKTIKSRRKHLRMSQEELALLSETSLNFICQLEAGKNTVRLNKLLDVLYALGLELNVINGSSQISFADDIE
ncbi:MAG: helix-turn-helix transcriptional regulator [Candidatus Riflebacteria bacterium]|nr:helix-turn-helix transcriptional regulator [Candidatus Riflebacteria bacterium]